MTDQSDTGGLAQGEALRRAREAARLTQGHLAGMAGVSTRTIMRVEGGALASADTIRAICAALGLDAAVLPAAVTSAPGSNQEDETETEVGHPLVAEPSTWHSMWAATRFARACLSIAALPIVAYLGLTLPTAVANGLAHTRLAEAGYPVDRMLSPFTARDVAGTIKAAMQARREGAAWDTAPRAYMGTPMCRHPGMFALLIDADALDCITPNFGLRTEAVTGDTFRGSLGPFRPDAAERFLRLLDPDPALRLHIAYGRETGDPGEGTLWYDPRELADGQIPRPRWDLTYIHISVERRGGIQ